MIPSNLQTFLTCLIGGLVLIGLIGTFFVMTGKYRGTQGWKFEKYLIATGWKMDNDGWYYHPGFPGKSYKFYHGEQK